MCAKKSYVNISCWLPKLQAHRGLWIHGAKQNTLTSIKLAFEAGYEMAELDVQITSDNIVILFHDFNIQGRQVKTIPYNEINRLVGGTVPKSVTALEELFKWIVTIENFKLNIEIKSQDIFNFKLEKRIDELINKYKLRKRVMISSFNPISLFKMRILSREIHRALLLSFENKKESQFIRYAGVLNFICKPHMLNLRYQDFSEYFIRLSQKVPIVLWTLNDLAIYAQYKNTIIGIISDSISPDDMKEVTHAQGH